MIKLFKGVLYIILAPAAFIALGFVLVLNAIFYLLGGDIRDDNSNQ